MFEKIVLITKGQLVEVNGRTWEIKKLIERDGQTLAKLKSGCRRRTVPIERIDAYYGE
jgi:C4-dicarboxylate-specific signal transduction histidine kinase